MHSNRLKALPNVVLDVVDLLVASDVISKAELAGHLGVSVKTITRYLDERSSRAGERPFDAIMGMLYFVEQMVSRSLDNSSRTPEENSKVSRVLDLIQPYMQEIGELLGPAGSVPIMSLLKFAKPIRPTFDALLGKTFVTVRFNHKANSIFASALRVYLDDVTGLVVWDNLHPVPDGMVSIGGVVSADGNYFRFTGTANDQPTMNSLVISTSQSEPTNPLWLGGLALVESRERIPLMTRVMLLRQERPLCDRDAAKYGPKTGRLPSLKSDTFLSDLAERCRSCDDEQVLKDFGLQNKRLLMPSPEANDLMRAISIEEANDLMRAISTGKVPD